MRLPFSIVEDTHFKEFASCLQPKFKMMDKSTLQVSCLNLYKKRKTTIAKQLHDHPGKIALTLQVWSNQQMFYFLKVTARYINLNWKLINRTLAFKSLSDPLDENVIVDCITSVLEDWGIGNKCGAITTESSTPNDLAVNKIREMLKERQILDPPGEYFHVRCGPTAVQEIVQEALKTTESVIAKVRRLVHLVTHSESSEKSFLELAGNLNLSCTKAPSRDILLRWDSTYLMISEALTFRLAFEHLDDTKPGYLDCPSPVEWLQLQTLKDALEVFHEAVGNLSSTDSPTANSLYLNMKKIERHLSKAEHYENNHSINIICPMANAFQKYWSSIKEFSEIASVLDPRLKFQYLEFSLVKQHGAKVAGEKLTISRNRLYTIFQRYLLSNLAVEQCVVEMKGVEGKGRDAHVDSEIDEFQKYLAGTTMIQTPYGSRTAELDLYLQEPVFQVAGQEREVFSVLGWWKAHALRFPTLVHLARNMLMIPMSCVTADLTFSMTARQLNEFHSSLEPDYLNSLMCGGDWLETVEHGPMK